MVIGIPKNPKQTNKKFHFVLGAEKIYKKFTCSNQPIYTLQIY